MGKYREFILFPSVFLKAIFIAPWPYAGQQSRSDKVHRYKSVNAKGKNCEPGLVK
jgi:hypothetical protein